MKRTTIHMLVALLIPIVLLGAMWIGFDYAVSRMFGDPLTEDELTALVRQGDTLVGAVKQYEATHGNRPHRLEELVPHYLQAIPPGNETRAEGSKWPEDFRWEYGPSMLMVRTGHYRVELQYWFDGRDEGWYINTDGDIRRLDLANSTPRPTEGYTEK